MTDYPSWFQRITGFPPHAWQAQLGEDEVFRHRLIRVPTGLGKTAGTALAWLYHAVVNKDATWPRRLVFTLPMRVLVEQVERTLRGWIEAAGLADKVPVHVLMGGVRAEPWVLHPECPQILIGTQDMILSRALCRGYGAARGRWPMDYALLHHDALWVLDEVQLMDVGLCTSVQLATFRDADAVDETKRGRLRPAACWWMSATLQPRWLETVDSAALVAPLRDAMVQVPPAQREGGPWAIRKPAERAADATTPAQLAAEMAKIAVERHTPGTLTLVIVNRVPRAVEAFEAVEAHYSEGTGKKRRRRDDAPDLRLVHSRFRGHERAAWAQGFLSRDASGREQMPAAGRIIVATQVVEAGVDISARLLVTELAPWSSLVQRAGRAGRVVADDGACVIVAGAVPDSDGDALPYLPRQLAAAAEAWAQLIDREGDASVAALTRFEDGLDADDRERLYPYDPAQVLGRSDVDELFDTTPDLSGADLDVGAFIRSGEERTVTVAWRKVDPRKRELSRGDIGAVTRAELCPVPVKDARAWLKGTPRPYVWDYLEGAWVRAQDSRIVPGAILIVPSERGGYDPERGWGPGHKGSVTPADDPAEAMDERDAQFDDTASAQSHDDSSHTGYRTIATHGRDTAERVRAIADELGLDARYRRLLDLAARWHDAGKAHDVFQRAIKDDIRNTSTEPIARRRDLAKAPRNAWVQPYPYPDRPGFRHELASTLALFELLRRADPDHPALLGGCRPMLEATGVAPEVLPDADRVRADDSLAAELAALDAESFDLLAYLVCAHHGKVRCVWTGAPADQERAARGYTVDDADSPSDQHEDETQDQGQAAAQGEDETQGQDEGQDAAQGEHEDETQAQDDTQDDTQGQAGSRLDGRAGDPDTAPSHTRDSAIFGVRDEDVLAPFALIDGDGRRVTTPPLTLHLDAAALGLGGRYGASWTERVSGNRTRLGPFALAYLESLLRAADHLASKNTIEDPLT